MNPRLANPGAAAKEWAALARMAVTCRDRRRESYPLLIAGNKISEADAKADLESWGLIVADWDWITTGSGKPASRDTLPQRIKATDTAIERWLTAYDNSRHIQPEFLHEGALIAALRWHLEPHPIGQSVHFLASVGHRWRATNKVTAITHRRNAA